MALSENSQLWFEWMRKEVAAIPEAKHAAVAAMKLAEVEFAYGLKDAARNTLVHCLRQFDTLHPGHWQPLIFRAAQLCGRLWENHLLEPEVRRGMAWLAQPEIVKHQGGLGENLRDIAIQTGMADVAAQLTSNGWPGKSANKLVDACRIAGWAKDAVAVRNGLPLAKAAVNAAEPGPDHVRPAVLYNLLQACVHAGLLTEAVQFCKEFSFFAAAGDLVVALWEEPDPAVYSYARDRLTSSLINRFRTEPLNHHHESLTIRSCVAMIRRLGDADGYRNAIRQFREAVAAWAPTEDWIACAVNCDLAVLFAKVGEGQVAADFLSAAKRMFEGKELALTSHRGSRSLMASILSAAHRDVGNIDLAVRFAKKCSASGERQMCLISALVTGGRVSEAETELAKIESPVQRVYLIGFSLLTEFGPPW